VHMLMRYAPAACAYANQSLGALLEFGQDLAPHQDACPLEHP
jgi:hypothetical protein